MLSDVKAVRGPVRLSLVACAASLSLLVPAQAQPVAPNQLARHAGQDTGEWSSFSTPAAAPPSVGPVANASWSSLREGGPWAPSDPTGLMPAEQEAMQLALAGRWPEVVALLKERGVQPDFRDAQGRTLLTLAAHAGDLSAVRGLIAQGADPDRIGSQGKTALGMAAWRGHELVVRELLFVGADARREDARGQTPLHLAAQMGRVRAMSMLIRAGGHVDAFNHAGFTPLIEAASMGQVPAMERLIQAGVPVGQTDRQGLNAVHAAALAEQAPAVAWLTGQGVPVQGVVTQVLIDTMGRRAPVVR